MKKNTTNQNSLNKAFPDFGSIGAILATIYAISKWKGAKASAEQERADYSDAVRSARKKIGRENIKRTASINRMIAAGAGPNTVSKYPSFDMSALPAGPGMPKDRFFGIIPGRPGQVHKEHITKLQGIKDTLQNDTESIDSLTRTPPPGFTLSMNSKGKNEMSKTEFFEEQMKKNLGLNSQEIKNRLSKAQFAGNNLAKIEDKYSWSPGVLQQEDIMSPGTVQFPESLPKPHDERLNSSSINKDLINEDFVEHMSRSLGVSSEHIISKLSLADFKQNPFLAKSGPDWKREKLTDAEVKKKNNIENPPLISDESPF